jgi:hypothetical protein
MNDQLIAIAVSLGEQMGMTSEDAMNEFCLMLENASMCRFDLFGLPAYKVRARFDELVQANVIRRVLRCLGLPYGRNKLMGRAMIEISLEVYADAV